jgi:glycosyltransferase A (GT-A) superfamily protein (DUF2064 family)
MALFAKWPQDGQVKTRLAAETSPACAAQVARAFLLDLVNRLGVVAAQRLLVVAPVEAASSFAELAGDGFAVALQGEGDLGQRMAAFFAAHLGERQGMISPLPRTLGRGVGAPNPSPQSTGEREAESPRIPLATGRRRVVLLGTDSPTIPLAYVEQAFDELERADVVLGPATDGGYYLIGCSRYIPALFEAIPWSTSGVVAETMARLTDPAWRLALLPPWYDIDTLNDWRMLRGHLLALRRAGLDPGVPHTERLAQDPSCS